MSLKEKVIEWGVLRSLKEMVESNLHGLSPFHKRVVGYVNEIHREQRAKIRSLDDFPCGDIVDPDDCCTIGDVIYHLQCQGMRLTAAVKILLEAAERAETTPPPAEEG